MKIETKYALTSEVWVMHQNKPTQFNVFSIEPVISVVHEPYRTSRTYIKYRFEERGFLYDESELFPTKEALLQSL